MDDLFFQLALLSWRLSRWNVTGGLKSETVAKLDENPMGTLSSSPQWSSQESSETTRSIPHFWFKKSKVWDMI